MSTLDCLVSEARTAFAAADSLDLAGREKALTDLFTSLQKAPPAVAEERLPELGAVLSRISELISSTPCHPKAEAKKRAQLKDVYEHGKRVLPVGVVLILADDNYPIASWAIPLAHCLRDGNVAVLVSTPKTLLTAVADVRVFECDAALEALPAVDAVIGPRTKIPDSVHLVHGAVRVSALETGPVPVIVDASVLKTPRVEGQVPHEIERVAAQVKYLHGRAYVLVASDVSDLVCAELGAGSHTYLSGAPNAPGVYAFSSLQQALDIAAELPSYAVIIYADRAVAARAAARMQRTVHINGYPAELVLGPYHGEHGFVDVVEVTVNQMPRHWCASVIKSLTPRTSSAKDVTMRESGITEEKDPRLRYWDYDSDGAGSWGMGWAFTV